MSVSCPVRTVRSRNRASAGENETQKRPISRFSGLLGPLTVALIASFSESDLLTSAAGIPEPRCPVRTVRSGNRASAAGNEAHFVRFLLRGPYWPSYGRMDGLLFRVKPFDISCRQPRAADTTSPPGGLPFSRSVTRGSRTRSRGHPMPRSTMASSIGPAPGRSTAVQE